MMSSCNVCMSSTLLVALFITSHAIDFVARGVREGIEEHRMVGLLGGVAFSMQHI